MRRDGFSVTSGKIVRVDAIIDIHGMFCEDWNRGFAEFVKNMYEVVVKGTCSFINPFALINLLLLRLQA